MICCKTCLNTVKTLLLSFHWWNKLKFLGLYSVLFVPIPYIRTLLLITLAFSQANKRYFSLPYLYVVQTSVRIMATVQELF